MTPRRFPAAAPRSGALALLIALAFAASPASSEAQAPARALLPDTAVIAIVAGKPIVAREFTDLYESAYPEDKPKADSLGRVEFLNSIVTRMLLANAARERNRELGFEDRAKLREFSNSIYSNTFFTKAVTDSVKVTEDDIRAAYECYRARYHLKRILFSTLKDAQRVRRDLLGGRIGWSLAVKRFSNGDERTRDGDFGWWECGSLGFSTSAYVQKLKVGQYSTIYPSDQGYELFFMAERREADPPAYDGIRAFIDGRLHEERTNERARRMQLQVAANIGLELDSTNIAFAAPHFPVPSSSDASGSTPLFSFDTSVPVFTSADTGRILARWKGGQMSLADYTHKFSEITVMMRPRVNDYWLLRNSVIATATSPFMLDFALAMGCDKDPGAISMIQRRTEELMVDHLYRDSVESKIWIRPEERRDFYEKNKRGFMTFELVRYGALSRDTKEQADSAAARLRAGETFYSILASDSLLGRQLGSVKEIREDRPGDPLYKLVFEQMKERQVEILGPIKDGTYLVLQVLERVQPRQLSYSEAEMYIDESVQNLKAEQMLAQFVDRLRKKYPVTTRPDLVMRIRLIRDF